MHIKAQNDGTIRLEFEKDQSGQTQKESYLFDENFNTLSWRVINESTFTDYQGMHEKDSVILQGQLMGEEISKSLKIDNDPFFAFPKFQMSPFVLDP